MPFCKTKLDASTFFCKFYAAVLGLDKKNRFFNLRKQTQHLTDNYLYDPLKEALACDAISTKVGDAIHPPSHIYTVQAVCQAWNQSRVRVRVKSVAGSFIQTIPQIQTKRGRKTITGLMPTSNDVF